jgi:hypothetical protein
VGGISVGSGGDVAVGGGSVAVIASVGFRVSVGVAVDMVVLKSQEVSTNMHRLPRNRFFTIFRIPKPFLFMIKTNHTLFVWCCQSPLQYYLRVYWGSLIEFFTHLWVLIMIKWVSTMGTPWLKVATFMPDNPHDILVDHVDYKPC